MSTSSPAIRNCGSKPPIASSASRRKAMLQPGMCSATSSESSTWVGPPGACATRSRRVPASSGSEVRAADAGVVGAAEGMREVARASAVGPGVVVGEGDDLARRRLEPGVASALRARGSRSGSGGRRTRAAIAAVCVGRAVVDDDHLVVRVVERAERLEAVGRSSPRRCTCRRRPRSRGPAASRGNGASANARRTAASAGFGRRSRSTSPKCPVVDVDAAAMPLVGPGEDERAGAAGRECRAQLPLEHAAPGRRSPLRRLSRPISVISSGRSPAMFWRRAR